VSKQPIASNSPFVPPVGVPAARMAAEDRRLQILRVAISLFARKGFRGTTTKEIAHAAGVSEAIIFRHFATKEELYSAILDHKACAGGGLDDICNTVAGAVESKDDRAVFEGLALTLLEHHEQDTEFMRLLSHAALEGHELTQMFWERNVLQMYEFLGSYIRERQGDGAFRQMEPKVAVRAFLGMVIHHSVNNNLWDPKRSVLDISNKEAARQFTEILLNGIEAKTGAGRTQHTGRRFSGVQRTTAKKKQTK
jgi:TetR/AcrR family transcriptional regulator